MSMLIHQVIPAGEIAEGDVFVTDEWHDSTLWGQTVTSVEILPADELAATNGRLVSLRFTGHCGMVTREHQLNEVLRAPMFECPTCGEADPTQCECV